MSKFQFTILFNDDETFKGVKLDSGKQYNLGAWNKIFSDLDPKSKETGTQVNGGNVTKKQ